MEHAHTSSGPTEATSPDRTVRGLAIVLGLAALVLFGFSLFFGAWVVSPFCGIIGWVAYGLWTGTTVPASNGDALWENSSDNIDPIYDPEFSSSPSNVYHHYHPHKVDTSPP